MGDGGAGGDPYGHGQNLYTLHGSMLGIDVNNPDEGLNYGIPDNNPFVGTGYRERSMLMVFETHGDSVSILSQHLLVADVAKTCMKK
ncbi:MAG: hypothetical protein Ct9H300mP9_0720 [Candidatus Neomarinimicrobiota bacterium]|nr:MAG: hypothetical protein Ct9H300mP9_0720 [Candidatus Neomarinimicrobiota bacterium]